jgi:hypothetical protein
MPPLGTTDFIAKRQCPFCGFPVGATLTQCPKCREAIPAVSVSARRAPPEASRTIRRGLLLMLLAAVAYYFAGGYSPMSLPIEISPLVTTYLLPLFFLAGLGVTLYGVYLYLRA